jgi:small subunit ribosomal protein S17
MSAEETKKTSTVRRIVGRVVSNKMDKSVTVSVERLIKHAVYGKYIRRTSKILAHDEENACKEGDTVAITECRPLSKRKSWRVVEVISESTSLETQG